MSASMYMCVQACAYVHKCVQACVPCAGMCLCACVQACACAHVCACCLHAQENLVKSPFPAPPAALASTVSIPAFLPVSRTSRYRNTQSELSESGFSPWAPAALAADVLLAPEQPPGRCLDLVSPSPPARRQVGAARRAVLIPGEAAGSTLAGLLGAPRERAARWRVTGMFHGGRNSQTTWLGPCTSTSRVWASRRLVHTLPPAPMSLCVWFSSRWLNIMVFTGASLRTKDVSIHPSQVKG